MLSRRDALAILLLALLPVLLLWKLTLGGRIVVGLDPFNFFYPYHDAAAAALRAGRLPQWNPWLFGGVPFLADSQAQLFYPLSWPFLLVSAPAALTWGVVMHLAIAGIGSYVWARHLGVGRAGALAGGVLVAGGGYLGAQVEHLNQVQAAAWLPWLLLAYDRARTQPRWWVVGAAALALSLLAGHTQTSFISLVMVGLWALYRTAEQVVVLCSESRSHAVGTVGSLGTVGTPRTSSHKFPQVPIVPTNSHRLPQTPIVPTSSHKFPLAQLAHPLLPLLAIVAVGMLIAAVQLVPTQALSALSTRAGGLSLRDAAAFSLHPKLLPRALLPHFGAGEPLLSEYVAYIGWLGLPLAALGAWVGRRRAAGHFGLLAAVTGLLLALGGYNPLFWLLWRIVPGFDLFRVPARWLLLWAVGAALLAGLGIEWLVRRAPRPTLAASLLVALLLGDLWLGAQGQKYQQATAPDAYAGLRPAPAALLALSDTPGQPRLLTMSDLTWDPGDLATLKARYDPLLGEEARYDFVVSTKLKEILAPNQPMRWAIATADGYGGGLLPTARWVTFQQVLPLAKVVPDGRLREQLTALPRTELLDMMGVGWLVADKNRDWWSEGIYHDLDGALTLQPRETLRWAVAEQGATVLSFVVRGDWPREAGTLIVAEQRIALSRATERATRETPYGTERHLWLTLPAPVTLAEMGIEGGSEVWQLAGLTLVDERLPSFQPLVADPTLHTYLSGDVKLYQREDAARAWLVPSARPAGNAAEAAALVAAPDFDPRATVIVEGEVMVQRGGTGQVTWLAESPEQLHLHIEAPEGGWLVLADAPAPGWVATVDSVEAAWQPANVINRALWLPAGTHQVTWRYETPGLRLGALLTMVGLLILSGGTLIHKARRPRVHN